MSSFVKAQELVENALAVSTADGQVTFVAEASETNLRWASNSLTTNGAMRSRRGPCIPSVVSFISRGPNTSFAKKSANVTPLT